jgi:nucleotide-binding universal stress UspA family protein
MFDTIVHPTDFSPESLPAFEHALRLALLNKSQFAVLHVSETSRKERWDSFPAVRDTLARWRLLSPDAKQEDVLAQVGIAVTKIQIREDNVLEGLSEFLLSRAPDLLVMASHGRAGFDALFNPSIAVELANATMVNTLVFGPRARGFVDSASGGHDRIKRVLVAVDHSPAANEALRTLGALAEGLGVDFDYLHVGDRAPILTGEPEQRPVRTLRGPVVETILAEAEQADLIAVPTVGRKSLLDALRGSTTERLVREATRPVLAIPV